MLHIQKFWFFWNLITSSFIWTQVVAQIFHFVVSQTIHPFPRFLEPTQESRLSKLISLLPVRIPPQVENTTNKVSRDCKIFQWLNVIWCFYKKWAAYFSSKQCQNGQCLQGKYWKVGQAWHHGSNMQAWCPLERRSDRSIKTKKLKMAITLLPRFELLVLTEVKKGPRDFNEIEIEQFWIYTYLVPSSQFFLKFQSN